MNSMIRENPQLVITDEPAEFEEYPVEVQDCRKINHHFRGIYGIFLEFNIENPEDVNV